MKKKRYILILWMILLLFDSCMPELLVNRAASYPGYHETDMLETIRNQEIEAEDANMLRDYAAGDEDLYAGLLLAYYYSGKKKERQLKKIYKRIESRYGEEVHRQTAYLKAVWSDIRYFPVPSSSLDKTKDVVFDDSWMQSRSFGGKRGHEGCDIMAADNQRGIYPVVSVSDGVVEKMGWLPMGGYRIGVRSEHGAYFYYAHLSDYADNLAVGDTVCAGELLAFMGDTGYSKAEGTTGNFDVHLHFGIYLNDENGTEFSVNSYSVLCTLQEKRLKYNF